MRQAQAQQGRGPMSAQDPNVRAQNAGVPQQRANFQVRGHQNVFGGGQAIDPTQFAGQQAEAYRSQDAGHVVVPASNNSSNPTSNLSGVGAAGLGNMMQPSQAGVMRPGIGNQGMLGQGVPGQQRGPVSNVQVQGNNVARAPSVQPNGQRQGQTPVPQGQLNGQVGGMHGRQPTQQSPEMPMLTQGMVPPGQSGVTAPQQRPHQQPLQGNNGQNAAQANPQLLQQQRAQNEILNAASQGQLLPTLPIQIRQRLMSMPQEQWRPALEQMFKNSANRGNRPSGVLPAQGQQMRSTQGQNGSIQPFGGQINMSNQASGGGQVGQNPAGLGQQNQPNPLARPIPNAEAIPQEIVQRLDQLPFNRSILSSSKAVVPDHVITWGQLKDFARNNPNSNLQVMMLQRMYYNSELRNQYMTATSRAGAMQDIGNGMPQLNGATAPQVPMMQNPKIANQTQPNILQRPPGLPANIAMPTMDKVRAIRAQLRPDQNLTDQQIINTILQSQLQSMKENHAAQRAQGQAQQIHPQAQHPPNNNGNQALSSAARNPTPQQQQQLHQHPQQHLPQRQHTPSNHNMRPQSAENRVVAGPAQQPTPVNNGSQIARGVKRPANDGNDGGLNANKFSHPIGLDQGLQAQQARLMQNSGYSREDIAKLTPQAPARLQEQIQANAQARNQSTAPQLNMNGAGMANNGPGAQSRTALVMQQKQKFDELCVEFGAILQQRAPLTLLPGDRQQIERKIGTSQELLNLLDRIFHILSTCPGDLQMIKPTLYWVSYINGWRSD